MTTSPALRFLSRGLSQRLPSSPCRPIGSLSRTGIDLAVDTWTPASVDAPSSGDRPPFLLVHGLASNARMWDGVATALVEEGHRVSALDLRGHGRSSKPDGPYDVPTVADDVAAVIERSTIDRPVVAGQSWGGNVVLELAARHPGLIRGIVCVDGGWLEPSLVFPDWEACRAALAPPRLAGRRLEEIEGYIRSAHPDWPETGIQGTLANFEVHSNGTISPWLTFDRHIAILRGLWDNHPMERYADVARPGPARARRQWSHGPGRAQTPGGRGGRRRDPERSRPLVHR